MYVEYFMQHLFLILDNYFWVFSYEKSMILNRICRQILEIFRQAKNYSFGIAD